MSNVFREINSAINSCNDNTRLTILRQINKYIKSGKWETKQGKSERILSVIGMKQSEACDKLGLSEGGYKILMKRTSDHIKSIIGDDTITTVLLGDKNEVQLAYNRFVIGVYGLQPNMYLQADVCDIIDVPYLREYNFDDLSEEIEWLRTKSKAKIHQEINSLGLDTDKLAYIVNILKSSSAIDDKLRSKLLTEIVLNDKNNLQYIKDYLK